MFLKQGRRAEIQSLRSAGWILSLDILRQGNFTVERRVHICIPGHAMQEKGSRK